MKSAVRILIAVMLVGGYTNLSFATPIEWSLSQGGNGHYYEAILRPGGITWSEAKAEAESAGGHLATVTTADENSFVNSLIGSNTDIWINGDVLGGNSLGPWIGGFKESYQWKWVTGEAFDYSNWSVGEPSNLYSVEDSIHFFGVGLNNFSSNWNDLPDNPEVSFNVPIDPVGYIVEYEKSPASTPEPATMLLLCTGIIGLVGLKKKVL